MSLMKPSRGSSTTFKVVLCIVLGAAIGAAVFQLFIGRPKVAVINIVNGEINSESTPQMLRALQHAGGDPRVKAVVIKLSSPGGGTADSTLLYMEVVKLREKKPVVVAVTDMAASGGYHLLLGASYVYANPASFIGNIGVILWLPRQGGPSENILTSGPFKRTGGSERMYITVLESLKNAFVKTVVAQRGDRLKMTADEVADGRIYLALEAVKLGLVDELGDDSDAIRKAAALARIRNYQVVDVNQELEDDGVELVYAKRGSYSLASFVPEFPYLYYRYVEPR